MRRRLSRSKRNVRRRALRRYAPLLPEDVSTLEEFGEMIRGDWILGELKRTSLLVRFVGLR